MKVFYTGQGFSNIITGGERRIAMILECFSKANAEVVYLQREDSPPEFVKRHFLLTNLWYIFQIAIINKTEDIVILEDYSQRFYLFLFNFFILILKKSITKRMKLVCLANAFYFSYRTSRLKNLIDKIVSILFLKPADLVIAGGEAARKELLKMGVPNEKVQTVYPALRPEFAKNYQRKEAISRNSPIQLLFVGRVNPIKGIEYLLEAIKLLDSQNLTLSIVGDTSFLPEYTQMIRDKIENLGIKDRVKLEGKIEDADKLLEIYKASDIFVLPSLWDTSPIAIIEAMCVGLPIVATNVGGIPEWVEDGVNGILVPPKDPKALANAILSLIKDPYLRGKMARQGYKKSFQFRNRTWEDVGREYYKVISELVRISDR